MSRRRGADDAGYAPIFRRRRLPDSPGQETAASEEAARPGDDYAAVDRLISFSSGHASRAAK